MVPFSLVIAGEEQTQRASENEDSWDDQHEPDASFQISGGIVGRGEDPVGKGAPGEEEEEATDSLQLQQQQPQPFGTFSGLIHQQNSVTLYEEPERHQEDLTSDAPFISE